MSQIGFVDTTNLISPALLTKLLVQSFANRKLKNFFMNN